MVNNTTREVVEIDWNLIEIENDNFFNSRPYSFSGKTGNCH